MDQEGPGSLCAAYGKDRLGECRPGRDQRRHSGRRDGSGLRRLSLIQRIRAEKRRQSHGGTYTLIFYKLFNKTIKLPIMLKQTMKAGIPVLAMILLAACGGGDGTAEKESAAAHEDHAAVPAAPVKLKDEKVNGIYQHYVHLTTALIKADSAEAKVAGTAIA